MFNAPSHDGYFKCFDNVPSIVVYFSQAQMPSKFWNIEILSQVNAQLDSGHRN
jgi:hypothetical protein